MLVPGTYKLLISWTVLPDGSVVDAKLVGPSQLLEPGLSFCMEAAMRTWRFPPSGTGAPVSNFPLGPLTVR